MENSRSRPVENSLWKRVVNSENADQQWMNIRECLPIFMLQFLPLSEKPTLCLFPPVFAAVTSWSLAASIPLGFPCVMFGIPLMTLKYQRRRKFDVHCEEKSLLNFFVPDSITLPRQRNPARKLYPWISLTLKTTPKVFPETSGQKYHYALRNDPRECRS